MEYINFNPIFEDEELNSFVFDWYYIIENEEDFTYDFVPHLYDCIVEFDIDFIFEVEENQVSIDFDFIFEEE